MIKAVIFDMDGVLLNTEPLYTIAYQKICLQYGATFTADLKSKIMGSAEKLAAEITIQTCALPLTVAEFISQKKAILQDLFAKVDALPGAQELVNYLKSRGIPIAVATGSPLDLFALKSQGHPWFSLFDAIVTSNMVQNGKPAPDIFLKAADALGVNPEDCLTFEDSLNGAQSALAAGMQVIAVPVPAFMHLFKEMDVTILPNLEAFEPSCWDLADSHQKSLSL